MLIYLLCYNSSDLEVVGDLTVETFLLAFQRITSRKSLPCKIISDFESELLKGALEAQKVTWDFIPNLPPGTEASGSASSPNK